MGNYDRNTQNSNNHAYNRHNHSTYDDSWINERICTDSSFEGVINNESSFGNGQSGRVVVKSRNNRNGDKSKRDTGNGAKGNANSTNTRCIL